MPTAVTKRRFSKCAPLSFQCPPLNLKRNLSLAVVAKLAEYMDEIDSCDCM